MKQGCVRCKKCMKMKSCHHSKHADGFFCSECFAEMYDKLVESVIRNYNERDRNER